MNERLAIRERLQNLLRQTGDRNGFADSDSLVMSGRLDSVDTLDLVLFLEEKYGVDFAERGFDKNDLDSLDSIMALIGAGSGGALSTTIR
jgi:acyl carrier protein